MATAESTSSSRFRTFNKLLQFESKPPPLPPKDPIYLQQRSVSQPRSTESPTPPPEAGGSGSKSNTFTPVSPVTEYAIRATSPTWLQTTASTTTTNSALSTNCSAHSGQMNMNTNVNWSTTTLALAQGNDGASGLTGSMSAVASSSSGGTGTRPGAIGAKKPLGFLKFPKRSPRLTSPVDNGGDPPPPKEDDGISLPWNFQHNIHVDEGFVGLPPSWLTSAGFSNGELADIQARRARSPPHLRYLYSERPNTPATTTNSHSNSLPLPGSGEAQRSNPTPFLPGHEHGNSPYSTPPMHGVPIIMNPMPRSTSLSPAQNVQTNDSSYNSHHGHRRNQPSASTVAYSADSHMVTGTTSSSNHSTIPSGSTSPSSHSAKDEKSVENGITSNPPKINVSELGVVTSASPDTIGDGLKEKKPFWGRPRLKSAKESSSSLGIELANNIPASSSTPNLSLLSSAPINPNSSSNPNLLNPSTKDLTSTSATSLLLDSTPSTSSTPLSTPPPHQTTHFHSVGTWNPKSKAKATASTLAAAGSSLVDTLKSSAVAAAGAGKGVWRMRVGKKGSSGPPSAFDTDGTMGRLGRSKSKSRRSDETFFAGGVGSDGEQEGGSGGARVPVWQLYMQPKSRPGTAGSTSGTSVTGSGMGGMQALSSSARQVGMSSSSLVSSGSSTTTAMAKVNRSSLRRQGSMSRSKSFGSLRSQKSQRSQSQRSQHSQNSPSIHSQLSQQGQGFMQVPGKGQGKSPGRVPPRLGHQPKSGSVTSLDSIPEASPAPGAVVVLAGMGERRGPAAASTGASGSGVVVTSSSSGSGYTFQSSDENGPRPAFSSGSTIASVPVITTTTASSSGSSSSIKGRHQPKLQHQYNNSVELTATASASTSAPPASISAKSSSSSLNANDASAHPTRPPPPPGSPLGLDAMLFSSSSGVPAPPTRPPPPPGSPLGLDQMHFQSPAGVPNDSVNTSFASSLNASTSTNLTSIVPTFIVNTEPLGIAPPRLSLHHQLSDGSASWSEALLTGLSFSHSSNWEEEMNWELGLETRVGGSNTKEKETHITTKVGTLGLASVTQREREGYGPASAPLASEFGGKSIFHAQQQQGLLQQQQQQGVRQPGQMHFHSQSLSTMLGPGSGSLGPASSSSANIGTGNTTTTSSTPSKFSANPTTPRRKNGQPLPLSKPPPRHPAPDPPIGILGSPSSSSTSLPHGPSKMMMPVSPMPLGLAVGMGISPGGNKPLPIAAPSLVQASTSATSTTDAGSGNANALPPQAEGLLSPTTGTWKSPITPGSGGIRVVTPGSSVAPDSAQLWNEIEQMMDPNMISNIPGLHLSTALPPGAKDALKSAGIGAGFPSHSFQVTMANGHAPAPDDPKTVRDLVGDSPPLLPTRGDGVGEDENGDVESDDDSDLMDDDVDLYDGVVQSAIARPIEPLSIRTGRTLTHEGEQIADPRLVNLLKSGERDQEGQQHLDVEDGLAQNRDSHRSSTSTITVAGFTSPPKIVRAVSIVRRADAYVIDKSRDRSPGPSVVSRSPERSGAPPAREARRVPAPVSVGPSGNSSDDSSGSGSSDSPSMGQPTPMTDAGIASPLFYYLDGAQTPSPTTPSSAAFHQLPSSKEFQSVLHEIEYDDGDEEYLDSPHVSISPGGGSMPPRPTIVINDDPLVEDGEQTGTTLSTSTSGVMPLSPFQRYRGWLSAIVAPLEEFIDDAVDPREHYLDLNEIAEGESGSVFAARLNAENAEKLRLPPLVKVQDGNDIASGQVKLVAIKSIAIVPSGSPKLVDLQRELTLMKGLGHTHVLGMDAVYVDLVEDSLWVRMELMERSLADIIGLVGEGLMLQDRMIARFASDVLLALDYLLSLNIAHRDVRSDNLLLNRFGILKLADFSNAVRVTSQNSMREDVVGVAFWQAPEVKRGPYNVLKIDVWSLGATVWEMAQTEPPFYGMAHTADRWPPLSKPELYSPAFHDFLRRCSEPAGSRPTASDLLKSSFINNSCGRPVIVQLLSQCMAIEGELRELNDAS